MAVSGPGGQREQPGLRDVGGTLVDAVVAQSSHARLELLRRTSRGRICWRFQQAAAAVLWFRSGVRQLRLDVDGERFQTRVSASRGLCFFPAGVRVEGEFAVDTTVDYTVAFVDPQVPAGCGARFPGRPLVGITHGPLERSLHELALNAGRPGALTELLVEGWSLQSLAHLSRLADAADATPVPKAPRPPLPAVELARIDAFVREHMAHKLTVDQLADVAGFSPRHFQRAFKEQTGQTPMRHVYALRLEEAKRLLARSEGTVTDIAAACGFSHVQHLATAIRRATGITPTQFRGDR